MAALADRHAATRTMVSVIAHRHPIAIGIEGAAADCQQSLGGTLLPKAGRSPLGSIRQWRKWGLGGHLGVFLKSRDIDGCTDFKSPARNCDDLVRRFSMPLNRRALEALILSGALDSFNKNRKQLMQDLPLVVDWAQSRAKDREVGQGNLFDMMMGGSDMGGGDNGSADAPAMGGYENSP